MSVPMQKTARKKLQLARRTISAPLDARSGQKGGNRHRTRQIQRRMHEACAGATRRSQMTHDTVKSTPHRKIPHQTWPPEGGRAVRTGGWPRGWREGGKWGRRWMIGMVGGVREGLRVGVVQGPPSAVGAGVLGAAGLVRRVLLDEAWRPKIPARAPHKPRCERGGGGRNGGGGGPTRSGERGAAVGGGRGRGGASGERRLGGRGRASYRGEKKTVSRSHRLPTSKRGREEGHGKQGGRGGGRGVRVGRHAGRWRSRGRGGLGSRTPCRRRLREVLYDDVSPPKRWSRRRAATGSRTPTPGGCWATRGAWPAAVTCAESRKTTAAGGRRGW